MPPSPVLSSADCHAFSRARSLVFCHPPAQGVARGYIEVRSVVPNAMPRQDGQSTQRVVESSLRYTEFDKLTQALPLLEKAIAVREIPMEIRHQDRGVDGRIVCTTSDFGPFMFPGLARGRFLARSDDEKSRDFVVLGGRCGRGLVPDG